MALSAPLQLSIEVRICRKYERNERFQNSRTSGEFRSFGANLSTIPLYSWSTNLSKRMRRRVCTIPSRNHQLKCHCFLNPGPFMGGTSAKNATLTMARLFTHLQGSPLVIKLASAVGIVVFALWGLGPLVQRSRNIFLHESDVSWKKSSTYHVTTFYIQPLLLWTGAIFVCRAMDPIILPSEAAQLVKQRLLHFLGSLSTVLAFAYCLSSVIQQAQKFFMETTESTDTRTMGFQFAGKAVYTAVWVAALSLFMELLGFSTQKWLTAGGLGTVLLTLAGREIFTNFLSSAMIHATRPFVVGEWIQTKIQGYEVSGTVEHVGWWSPTIIRGDDREAVHIPNHKFTVNVVRNLSQKTHWRIKTHLAISHLDVGKINNIVADMRKVLAKNPQVEQQKLHRRVFLDNINPENQALLILVSCFVKTSRFEEYLCVKEAILQDLLRVIRHHRARLATPLRTVQKVFSDADFDSIPFSESLFNERAASKREAILIEPSYKINGDDKTKTQPRSGHLNGEEERTATAKPTSDTKTDAKDATTDSKSRETDSTEDPKSAAKTADDQKLDSSIKKSKTESPTTSQPKQEDVVRQQVKPTFEENIVLGVALDGSKRTLPIEEDTMPSSNVDDVKEMAVHNGNGPAVAKKERSSSPNSPGGDKPDQLDK